MNAAILGAGGAGLLHALAYRAHGVAVAHVYDPVPERAQNLADLCGARVHDSLESIADAGAACVSICSPPLVHVAQAERCAALARVVFVEKPVAVSAEELERLERVPQCVPIVQWRAGRALRAMRRALLAGLLGPAPSISVDMALHRDAAYFAAGRDARAWGCGALLSLGIHAIDAVCFAVGHDVVAAHGALGPRDGERAGGLVLEFEGGAIAMLRVSLDGGPPDETRLTFCGGGVTATIAGTEDDPTAMPIAWKTHDDTLRAKLEAVEALAGGWRGSPLVVPYLGQALDALRAGWEPGESALLPSIRDVARAHAIALARG
jgi:predicted dehydrogenase